MNKTLTRLLCILLALLLLAALLPLGFASAEEDDAVHIRTAEDLGVLVLLDDRFLERDYLSLLPEDWDSIYQVNVSNYGMLLEDFWKKSKKK